ncbi:MAG: UdgX family uracil-DNA binding protein [Sphingopyxis sp.]|nr:UdgX family uracil-DNA binding protein [Sphingopyxis sp.]
MAAAAGHDFAAWRNVARGLLARGVAPDQVAWNDATSGERDLFAIDEPAPVPSASVSAVTVPKQFLSAARLAILHRNAARHGLLYRLLWRLQAQPQLLRDAADADVRSIELLVREVRRDIHKMRAFVRFNPVRDADGKERYVAWFEPAHQIVEANADFFVGRFHAMRWSILTPDAAVHWDGETLTYGPGGVRPAADAGDPFEAMWLSYYASIFNPARLKIGAMTKEMPKKYWQNLPEAALIPDLIAGARGRELAMVAQGEASFTRPVPTSLPAIAEAVAACRACPIGCNGTRAVMGEGPATAGLMIIGEQPGDHEEASGRPFVGPAGQVLDNHLERAGIARGSAYVTNAVKHFKYEQRGKRRLHQSPTAGEIDHCRWWLDNERKLVQPKIIVALGASAGRALMGRTPSINRERGQPQTLADGTTLWLTAHPSYLLRLPEDRRADEEQRFAADLSAVAASLDSRVL